MEWLERFIPGLTYATPACTTVDGGGASLTSIDVVSGGSDFTSTPTVIISPPGNGGNTATATATVDTSPGSPTFGQITAITLVDGGSRYLLAPNITVSGGGGSIIFGAFLVHLGDEAVKSYEWSGVVPSGYDDDDSATWPVSDEYLLPIPATNGTLSVVTNSIKYFCECAP